MSILRMFLRAALMALLAVVLPSWANDNFPTSENPATGKWRVMKPSSFKTDMTSVLEQCNRAANASGTDRLTTDMCQRLPTMIMDNKCRKEPNVPDGIVFDFMNGHESGHSRVTTGVEKSLGRSDPALVCDLGNRTFAYWFVGVKGQSCNNVGIVFVAPPKVVTPAPQPVAGMCGLNTRRYSVAETTWSVGGNFCAVGEQSSPSILFPSTGSSSRWSCAGRHGGQSVSCEATRDATPQVVATKPPEPKCEMVKRRYIVPSSSQTVYIPGLSVAVCKGVVPIPEIYFQLPSSVTTVTREEKVCN